MRADVRLADGGAVVPLALPIGSEASFSGVVDLVAMEARTYAAGPNGAKGAIPFRPRRFPVKRVRASCSPSGQA